MFYPGGAATLKYMFVTKRPLHILLTKNVGLMKPRITGESIATSSLIKQSLFPKIPTAGIFPASRIQLPLNNYPVSLLSKRCLHTQFQSSKLGSRGLSRFRSRPNQEFRRSISNFPDPKFPFTRVYRFGPLGFFFFTSFFFTFLVFLTPLIFNLLFPLLIIGVVLFQFSKWRVRKYSYEVSSLLKRSPLRVRYRTLNSLQYRFVPRELSEAFNFDTKEADKFLTFVEGRVIETFNKNEGGIEAYFFPQSPIGGRDFSKELKLGTMSPRILGSQIDNDLLLNIRFPLYYVPPDAGQYPNATGWNNFAEVIVSILDDSMGQNKELKLFRELADTNQTCRMVITIKTKDFMAPKRFVYDTAGDQEDFFLENFGEGRKSDKSRESREFVVKDKGGDGNNRN